MGKTSWVIFCGHHSDLLYGNKTNKKEETFIFASTNKATWCSVVPNTLWHVFYRSKCTPIIYFKWVPYKHMWEWNLVEHSISRTRLSICIFISHLHKFALYAGVLISFQKLSVLLRLYFLYSRCTEHESSSLQKSQIRLRQKS